MLLKRIYPKKSLDCEIKTSSEKGQCTDLLNQSAQVAAMMLVQK